MNAQRITALAVGFGMVMLTSCAAPPTQEEIAAASKGMTRKDLEIVDCLLPGQVRQLGNSTYLTPRRPTRTTASDCRIRGGEYVAYDRTNLKAALRIWMETAEAGDPEAMTVVGEIYERGLEGNPDFVTAASWYQKAADKGYSRAYFSLGSLYEQGLGVEQDKLKALNFYRLSWGLPEDSVMYQSAARQEQDALRKELDEQVSQKNQQLALLDKQLKQAQEQVNKKPAASRSANDVAEIAALRKWIENLEGERRVSTDRLAGLPKLRTPQAAAAQVAPMAATADSRKAEGLDFGRYYALIIGNQNYRSMEKLTTPLGDAERAAKVLADKYGFNVQILEDASDVAMLKALNDLNQVLTDKDNLLIYYAGHGTRLMNGKAESGYWLPVNADPPPQDTFWVPNEQITGHLGRMSAKRVLVVADSCYAGLLSTDPSHLFISDRVGYSRDYVAYKLPKRSRMLISSGGDQPVLDSGGGNNSVFARAFIDELDANQGVMSTPELFAKLQKRVATAAANNQFVQKPEFKSIKAAGHEVGDFFFVPTKKS
jgi:TPR repeat protein